MSPQTKLTITDRLPYENVVLVLGNKPSLMKTSLAKRLQIPSTQWFAILQQMTPRHTGATTTTWIGSRKIHIAVLPTIRSRHNSPAGVWTIPKMCAGIRNVDKAGILLGVEDDHLEATVMAVARGIPSTSFKSKSKHRGFSFTCFFLFL